MYGIIFKPPFVAITYIFTLFLCFASTANSQTSAPLFTVKSHYLEPFADSATRFDSAGSARFRTAIDAYKRGKAADALLQLDSALKLIPEMEEYIQLYRMLSLAALKRKADADSIPSLLLRTKTRSPAISRAASAIIELSIPANSWERLKIADKLSRETKYPQALYLTALLADSLDEQEMAKKCRLDLLRSKRVNQFTDSTADKLYRKRKSIDDAVLLELARFLEWRMRWDDLYTLTIEAIDQRNENRVLFTSMAQNAAYRKKNFFESLRLLRIWESLEGRTQETLFKYALNLEKLQYWRASWILYREYLTRWPKGQHGDNFIWDLGRRLEKRGMFDRAAAVFLDLEKQYPKEGYAPESRFRAAYCLYKDSSFDLAADLFSGFTARYPDSKNADASLYWASQAFKASGKKDSALEYLNKCTQRDPMSFYALLSEDELGNISIDSSRENPTAYSMEAFLDSLNKGQPGKDEDPLPIKRGVLLLQAGLNDMAAEEFDDAARWSRRKADRLVRLARLYETAGYYTKAYRTSMELSYRIPQEMRRSVPAEIMKLFFPRYFGEAIDNEARKVGIDPLFVQSVMRQESQFDHRVISRAGAKGLLQMMPATGRETANRAGCAFDADSLTHPFFNIKLGTYHLSELLDHFKGSYEWTLAAYNAGSGPAGKWSNETKGLPYDRSIEEIAYGETRQYVKLCMRNYRFYKKIWGSN
ncbi:MAG: transglycosylase SLT domain-containing protein [Fibrobacteres bacterium]|nr:transglycosylase SLT domain-containing protein [Fibrobacterota bacterium]